MKVEISTIISVLAILISLTTAWLTIFHQGVVKMTRPNFFALLPRDGLKANFPKFFLRTLLFSSGKRGLAIEGMFIKIICNGQVQRFLYWSYGEREKLVPGSGMFVGPEGVECNHHFTQIEDHSTYKFEPGQYRVEVFGKTVGSPKPLCLQVLEFRLKDEEALALRESKKDTAIYFWWDAEAEAYYSRIDIKPNHI